MKPVKFDINLLKKLQKIKLTNPKLYKKIESKLELFQSDPKHPSLRLHKITNDVGSTLSISIDKSIRMLHTNLEDKIYFFNLGTHDEVYRKK